jgi:hypothetical protein
VRRDEVECAQLRHLALQPPVLLRQGLAAALQELAVHFGLLQLRPGQFHGWFIRIVDSQIEEYIYKRPGLRLKRGNGLVLNYLPRSAVLEPNLHLTRLQVQLLRQRRLLLLSKRRYRGKEISIFSLSLFS